jgi:3-dehydroquinate synthase
MGHDKKVKHGQIRLILLKSIGDAVMTNEFDGQLLHEVLSKHSA